MYSILESLPHFSMQRHSAVQAWRQHQRLLDALSTKQAFLLGYVFVCLNTVTVDVYKVMLAMSYITFLRQFWMACSSMPSLLSPVEPCFWDPCSFFLVVLVMSWPRSVSSFYGTLLFCGFKFEGRLWGSFSSLFRGLRRQGVCSFVVLVETVGLALVCGAILM